MIILESDSMNRAKYYNFIEEKICTLCTRIANRGKLNILDYHLHSENFYRDLLNKLYDWSLENLNTTIQNVEAIDLIEEEKHIIIQVSATNTKSKIEKTLEKLSSPEKLTQYKGYSFKFVSIAREADILRSHEYILPSGLFFCPTKDIYDAPSILRDINNLSIERLELIYNLINSELGSKDSQIRVGSNLSTIIKLLAKEDLSCILIESNLNSFEIDKKIDFNNLISTKFIIDDYKVYHHIVDRIYAEFDRMGSNKSLSVMNIIRNEYIQNQANLFGDCLFNVIVENIVKRLIENIECSHIPSEEIYLCVRILIVDAFIRCKIFINPTNYSYVAT